MKEGYHPSVKYQPGLRDLQTSVPRHNDFFCLYLALKRKTQPYNTHSILHKHAHMLHELLILQLPQQLRFSDTMLHMLHIAHISHMSQLPQTSPTSSVSEHHYPRRHCPAPRPHQHLQEPPPGRHLPSPPVAPAAGCSAEAARSGAAPEAEAPRCSPP